MQRSTRVVRNVATTLATQILSWAVSIVPTYYIWRYLGAYGNGELTWAGSFAYVFSLIVAMVSGTALLRDIARDHGRLSELVTTALVLRIPLGVIATVLGMSFAYAFAGPLHYTHELRVLFFLGLLLVTATQINDVLASALRGLEEIPYVNLGSLAEKVVGGVTILILLFRHAPLSWLVSTGFLSSAVSFCIYARALRPHFTRFIWPSWTAAKALLTTSLPFITTGVFVAVYGQSDAHLLAALASVSAIGWYGMAKKLGGTCMFLPTALSSAILPTLSRLYHEDRAQFDRITRRFVDYMFLLVVPFAGVLILAPVPLLRLLHLDVSFGGSVPVLIVLGFAIILWYLSQATGTALIASDGQRVLSRVTGIAAVISVPICAVLVWLTQRSLSNGAIGAMAADAIVELYMVSAYVKALPSGCITSRQIGMLYKGVLASLPIVLPLYLMHGGRWSLLVTIPGLVAYLPICFALGCIEQDDVRLARKSLEGRFGMKTDAEVGQPEIPNASESMLDAGLGDAVSLRALEDEEQGLAAAEH